MKPLIVVCDGMASSAFTELQSISQFTVHPKPINTREELKEIIPQAFGIIVRSATKVDDDLLAKALLLKYVVRAGEGTDNIDKTLCAQRNIKVSNTPGANNNSAAEHALGLIFAVLKKIAWAHAKMRAGGWDKTLFVGSEIAGKKVGIIGLGRVGQLVAQKLNALSAEISFYDPFVDNGVLPQVQKRDSLEEIFAASDIVTLHIPLNKSTRGLVSRQLLECMPAHGILINAARGGIVDEDALCDILARKAIKGAGLDVFASEPLGEKHRLRQLDSVVLTPHLGASTEEAQLRVGNMAVFQMREFLLNHRLLNEVKV